jgi:hypothetical protein
MCFSSFYFDLFFRFFFYFLFQLAAIYQRFELESSDWAHFLCLFELFPDFAIPCQGCASPPWGWSCRYRYGLHVIRWTRDSGVQLILWLGDQLVTCPVGQISHVLKLVT